MANHESVPGQNPDSALGQGHGLVIGQNYGLGLEHFHDLSLGDPHDSGLVLGDCHPYNHGDDHRSELVLEQNHDHGTDPLSVQNHNGGLLDSHELALIDPRGLEEDHPLDHLSIDQSQELTILKPRTLVVSPNYEFTVGQEFADVGRCRRAIQDAAIACNFEIETVKSDKTRFTAKCTVEGCPWRIHCAKLPDVPTFTIRTIHGNHTCIGMTHLGHQQASASWVANIVEERLRENPNYNPKEIMEDIHLRYGITLSYKQAWRGKERVLAAVRLSFEEGYRLLPQYCEQIRRTNPGSIALVYGNDADNCFRRLIVSYYGSIYGFVNACRPLIGLDRALLKSEYHGTLMFATGFDGDGDLFPLAFGVVDEESDDNWIWFLTELHNLLKANSENMPRLTILSDRRKGILDGVDINFPTAFHGFCMHNLTDRFRKEFDNSVLVDLLWEAARALTAIEFLTKMSEIESISHEAAYWIKCIPHHLWATAYFEGMHYGHLTTNIVESLNSWFSEASGLPVVQMMESIRQQLMTWFNERRAASMQWLTILVPSAEQHVSEAVERAQGYQVGRSNEAEFVVSSLHGGTNIVDIWKRCCLCRGWQVYGLPCAHSVATLLSCRQNVHRYTENYFAVATYRTTYSQIIHSLPDKSLWRELPEGAQNVEDRVEIVINPPKLLAPPEGRERREFGRRTMGE